MGNFEKREPKDRLLTDPQKPGASGKGLIDKIVVLATGLDDRTDPDTKGELWKKADTLVIGDGWALGGFGTTNAFDNWEISEMDKLARAYELWLGRSYGKGMYLCCCSAADEK